MFELGTVVNMGVMLLITIAVIVLLGFFSEKFKILVPSSGQDVELIGGTSLGKKNKLVLIKVLDKKILLGVSDQQINTLCVFDQKTEVNVTDLQDLKVSINA